MTEEEFRSRVVKVVNALQKDVADALADIFSALSLIILAINSFPATEAGEVQRIEYRVFRRIQDQHNKWSARSGGVPRGRKKP